MYLNLQTLELYHNVWIDSNQNEGIPSHIVYIDDLIAPTIQLLNKKGYKTVFSCSDHPICKSPTFTPIQDSFFYDMKVLGGYEEMYHETMIVFDKEYDLGELPDGWYYDEDNRDTIRHDNIITNMENLGDIDGNEYMNSVRYLVDTIEVLYNHVKNLPQIYKKSCLKFI